MQRLGLSSFVYGPLKLSRLEESAVRRRLLLFFFFAFVAVVQQRPYWRPDLEGIKKIWNALLLSFPLFYSAASCCMYIHLSPLSPCLFHISILLASELNPFPCSSLLLFIFPRFSLSLSLPLSLSLKSLHSFSFSLALSFFSFHWSSALRRSYLLFPSCLSLTNVNLCLPLFLGLTLCALSTCLSPRLFFLSFHLFLSLFPLSVCVFFSTVSLSFAHDLASSRFFASTFWPSRNLSCHSF